MIRAALLSLILTAPAGAEGLAGQALCEAVWDGFREAVGADWLTGRMRWYNDGWCVVEDVVYASDGGLDPEAHIDRLRYQGPAFAWALDDKTSPDWLRLEIEGLRLFARTGDPRMDWLLAAQAKPNRIDARLAMSWDAEDKELRTERLSVDFPGDSFVEFSALVTGVELLPVDTFLDRVDKIAVRESELTLRTHGLFEDYLLTTLGPFVLPEDGDMEFAAKQLRRKLIEQADELDRKNLPDTSKAALVAFVTELPNPSGTLRVSLQGNLGFNPYLAFFSWAWGMDASVVLTTGLQDTIVEIGWTNVDAL